MTEPLENLSTFEAKLKNATIDAKTAIEVATELALSQWGLAHKKADGLRVDVAKAQVELQDKNPNMSAREVKTRVEATPLFLEYLTAEHRVKRIEEVIKIAKKHADVARF